MGLTLELVWLITLAIVNSQQNALVFILLGTEVEVQSFQ